MTHERHYIIRSQVNYDIDATASGWVYGSNITPVTYRFMKLKLGDDPTLAFTAKELFDFHGERYGFTTGIAVAVQSVKAWGPLPPNPVRLWAYVDPYNGCAPQSYEDVGTGTQRAKLGFHFPILQWFTSPAATEIFKLAYQTGDVSAPMLGADMVLGVVDVSFVARNNI